MRGFRDIGRGLGSGLVRPGRGRAHFLVDSQTWRKREVRGAEGIEANRTSPRLSIDAADPARDWDRRDAM
jgi:hypothetical protein